MTVLASMEKLLLALMYRHLRQRLVPGVRMCSGSCGIMAATSFLPANPFFAIVNSVGKCSCPPPQICDE